MKTLKKILYLMIICAIGSMQPATKQQKKPSKPVKKAAVVKKPKAKPAAPRRAADHQKPDNPIVTKDPSLVQLPVYYQGNKDGGGGASCGYHTLLRSMELANGLHSGKTVKELQKKLISPEEIRKYFGSKGSWRLDIVAQRIHEDFRSFLYKKWVEGLRKDVAISDAYAQKWHGQYSTKSSLNDKITGLYRSAFGSITDSIIALLHGHNNPLLHGQSVDKFKMTDDIIRDLIKKSLSHIANPTNTNLIEELKDDEMIDKYVDYSKIRKNFLADNALVNWKKVEDKHAQAFQQTSRGKGDWLDDVEVREIWKKHAKDILRSPHIDCGFMTIEDFNRLGNADIDSVTPTIINKIKPKLNNPQEFFYIFALGTMKQVGDGGVNGHWYALVLHQDSAGNRKYYIMDSMKSDRTHDKNAGKIINLIEK